MVLLAREKNILKALILLLLAAFVLANLVFNLQGMLLGPDYLPEVVESPPVGYPGVLPPFEHLSGLLLASIVVLLALTIVSLIFLRKKGEGKEVLLELLGAVLALVFIIVFFILWRIFAGISLFTEQGIVTDGSGGFTESTVSLSPAPAAAIGIGVIGAAFLLILLGFSLSRRLGRVEEPDLSTGVRRKAISHIEETLYRLRLGEEVRSAILKCYAGMTQLFRKRGLRFGDYVTARELEQLARKRMALSSGSAIRLRELFEEARYSSHILSDEYKDAAIQCLNKVMAELEVPLPTS
ncbi:MAG: DUF4129 domain-containing protein [Thermoplasmata archaeon]